MALFLSSLGPFFSPFFSFFFFFFIAGLSSAFDFSRSKDFSISKELPHVNFVKCAMQTKYANKILKEPKDERLSPKFPQQTRPRSRL